MFKNIFQKSEGLILLNDETVFMPQSHGVRLPIRITNDTAKRIINKIKSEDIDRFSCLATVTAEWIDNKLIINTTYTPRTKCKPTLYTKSRPIKTGICIEKICTGKCVDKFMREMIARYIMPELYQDNQR